MDAVHGDKVGRGRYGGIPGNKALGTIRKTGQGGGSGNAPMSASGRQSGGRHAWDEIGMKVVFTGVLIMAIPISITIIAVGAVLLAAAGLVEMPEEEMEVLLALAALAVIPATVCMFAGMIICDAAGGSGRPRGGE